MNTNDGAIVRPVFFFNSNQSIGETLDFVFFEPRYRMMMQTIMSRHRQFIYLPNFVDYTPKYGDVGLIAQVNECIALPDGRYVTSSTLVSNVLVTCYWVQPKSQGLYFARVLPLPEHLPPQSQILECIDALMRPLDSRMIVNQTRMGYLPVYGQPCNPHRDRAREVGRLYAGEEVNVSEARGDWVRHATGWSVAKCQDIDFLSPVRCHLKTISHEANVLLRPVMGRTENDFIVCRGSEAGVAKAKALLNAVSFQMCDHVFFDTVPEQSLVNLMYFVNAIIDCVHEDFMLPPQQPHRQHKQHKQQQQFEACRSEELIQTLQACIVRMGVPRLYGMVNTPYYISGFSLLTREKFEKVAENLLQSLPENLLPLSQAHPLVVDQCMIEFSGPESNSQAFSQFLHVSRDEAVEKLRQVKLRLNRERIRLMLVGRYDPGSVFSQLPVDVMELIKNHLVECSLPAQ